MAIKLLHSYVKLYNTENGTKIKIAPPLPSPPTQFSTSLCYSFAVIVLDQCFLPEQPFLNIVGLLDVNLSLSLPFVRTVVLPPAFPLL